MPVTKIKLERFTAFKELEVEFSPGINALVGANGTGKTHLMKACYAACDVSRTGDNLAQKLIGVFLPSRRNGGRLVQRDDDQAKGEVAVHIGTRRMFASFEGHATSSGGGMIDRTVGSKETVYIPVKEMLANAPGFLSLYAAREIHFEEVYQDILHRAYLPPLRGPIDVLHERLLESIRSVIGGEITVNGEEFFLTDEEGDLEFNLLAEGWRKLGLLWLLIRNGTLQNGSVLFWDEPETNLNPKMFKIVMNVLLELQRGGVQVFFATHDYVILKELDLQMTEEDNVAFHSLYRDKETGEIACHTTNHYLGIHHNAIDEAFTDLYDREIMRSFGGSSL